MMFGSTGAFVSPKAGLETKFSEHSGRHNVHPKESNCSIAET